MPTPQEILQAARHVVVQDFPTRDVPDTLTRAGFTVTIYGGPAESDVVASELVDGDVVHRQVGRYPDRADLLYTYRPSAEIDEIITETRRLGARTIWHEPGTPAAGHDDAALWRPKVEAAGLTYVDAPSIAEVARQLT